MFYKKNIDFLSREIRNLAYLIDQQQDYIEKINLKLNALLNDLGKECAIELFPETKKCIIKNKKNETNS